MTKPTNLFGMPPEERAHLVARLAGLPAAPVAADRPDPASLDGADELRLMARGAQMLGIADPFLRMHDGIAGAETVIDNRRYLNFSSYDYLGLNGDPRVADAAKEAIDRYGTTVSASRTVSGERPLHRELEAALARFHGAEDAMVLVSGHATNVSLTGSLLGADDAVAHDALAHNSIVEGARLSGARRLAFPHNDAAAADRLLHEARPRRALIAIEGHYSMDGDVPDLAAFVAVARRHCAWLMVDDAHALGVLGANGRGSAEHAGVDPREVDIWMGTLSKSLVSSGGYIAGSRKLIAYLKRRVPGFVFSVGLAPPAAAAALAALQILEAEPERVTRLRSHASLFLHLLRDGGVDTGTTIGAAIVPVMTGSSIRAAKLAAALFARGISAAPIFYPAVPERAARVRFFITAAHSEEQLREAARAIIEETRAVAAEPLDITSLARTLAGSSTGL
jgi:8-amino-7-oxononanoate synthase